MDERDPAVDPRPDVADDDPSRRRVLRDRTRQDRGAGTRDHELGNRFAVIGFDRKARGDPCCRQRVVEEATSRGPDGRRDERDRGQGAHVDRPVRSPRCRPRREDGHVLLGLELHRGETGLVDRQV
jgi:hypothetical protein